MVRTWELSSQEMCVHYQPSYQHQNPVNHSDLQGPPAILVNKGPMSAIALYSLVCFFFFGVGLSNYSVVYANTEGALGASSGALLLLGNPFIFQIKYVKHILSFLNS